MLDTTKPWYLSKTIWSGISTSMFALLMAAGIIPATVSETLADEAALVFLGLSTIYSRVKAETKIEKVITLEN